GLVAGLLGNIGHVLNSHGLIHAAKIAAWALPFEALYQDALRAITESTSGLTGFLLRLRPVGGAQEGGVGVRLWAGAGLGGGGAWGGAARGASGRARGVGAGGRGVAGGRPPAAPFVQERQDERGHRLAADAGARGLGERGLDQRLDVVEARRRRLCQHEPGS